MAEQELWKQLRDQVTQDLERREPDPQHPTFTEVMQLAEEYFTFYGNSHGDAFFATSIVAKSDPATALHQFTNAALARWGTPANNIYQEDWNHGQ